MGRSWFVRIPFLIPFLHSSNRNPDFTCLHWYRFDVEMFCQSSSLPGPSGESRNGRDGRDDGLGALGLALRKFLAFVLEL